VAAVNVFPFISRRFFWGWRLPLLLVPSFLSFVPMLFRIRTRCLSPLLSKQQFIGGWKASAKVLHALRVPQHHLFSLGLNATLTLHVISHVITITIFIFVWRFYLFLLCLTCFLVDSPNKPVPRSNVGIFCFPCPPDPTSKSSKSPLLLGLACCWPCVAACRNILFR